MQKVKNNIMKISVMINFFVVIFGNFFLYAGEDTSEKKLIALFENNLKNENYENALLILKQEQRNKKFCEKKYKKIFIDIVPKEIILFNENNCKLLVQIKRTLGIDDKKAPLIQIVTKKSKSSLDLTSKNQNSINQNCNLQKILKTTKNIFSSAHLPFLFMCIFSFGVMVYYYFKKSNSSFFLNKLTFLCENKK